MRPFLALAVFTLLPSSLFAQVQSPVIDPKGDAIDPFGAGPPLLDIDAVDLRYDAAHLHFEMTFHTPISPGSRMQPDSLVGVLELDLDQTNETGDPPLQNSFSPPFPSLDIGVDAYLFLDDSGSPGLLPLVDKTGLLGEIKADFGEMSVSGSIPLEILGDNGRVHYSGIIGTFNQPTDAMDAYGISVMVPEPASLLLLTASALLLGRRSR
jgi:hypothetical protein